MNVDDLALLTRSPTPIPAAHTLGRAWSLERAVGADVLYRQLSSGQPGWISDRRGVRRPLPIGRWLGGDLATDDDRRVDGLILGLCNGPTMDVGCGPGRFTAGLGQRGVSALGIDASAAAVEMTVERGGNALHADVFTPMPGLGAWSYVLLADGNVGIGGDPLRILRRARQLLHPDGVVVAEIEPRSVGVCREYRRWETDCSVGAWFPWAHVGSDAVGTLAGSAGFVLLHAINVLDRHIVVMRAS